MKERKKPYTFRLNQKVSNDLSKLASAFRMDRTAMLEYIITTYACMWVNADEPNNNEEKVLE